MLASDNLRVNNPLQRVCQRWIYNLIDIHILWFIIFIYCVPFWTKLKLKSTYIILVEVIVLFFILFGNLCLMQVLLKQSISQIIPTIQNCLQSFLLVTIFFYEKKKKTDANCFQTKMHRCNVHISLKSYYRRF